jgi:hypothetical protein
MANKEEDAQAERAKRLEEILKKGPSGPPKSPHEFTQERMRELEEEKKKKGTG